MKRKQWPLAKLVRTCRSAVIVWAALLELGRGRRTFWVQRDKITEASGIERVATISAAMTALRRAGWIRKKNVRTKTDKGGVREGILVRMIPVARFSLHRGRSEKRYTGDEHVARKTRHYGRSEKRATLPSGESTTHSLPSGRKGGNPPSLPAGRGDTPPEGSAPAPQVWVGGPPMPEAYMTRDEIIAHKNACEKLHWAWQDCATPEAREKFKQERAHEFSRRHWMTPDRRAAYDSALRAWQEAMEALKQPPKESTRP